MDVLSSFGSEPAQGRSRRMRSWYLFEQYKALEQRQSEAAERLRLRSYQEGLLTRELCERRQRRRLADPSRSETHLQAKFSDTRSAADELYEHFCACHDEELSQAMDTDASVDSEGSADDSVVEKPPEDYESADEETKQESRCSTGDVTSVVENVRSLGDVAEDIKEQIEAAKKDIAQNIRMQLAAFRPCNSPPEFEFDASSTLAKLSFCPAAEPAPRVPRVKSTSSMSVLALWSRLVSFAYQVMQLNHGNCYCDYSSQLLTAVLAFDVLRRGLCGICNPTFHR